jgi:hypothetical protein
VTIWTRSVVPTLFSLGYLNISQGLGGHVDDFSVYCVTVAVHCTLDATNENKGVGSVLSLLHKCHYTSVQLVYAFLCVCVCVHVRVHV